MTSNERTTLQTIALVVAILLCTAAMGRAEAAPRAPVSMCALNTGLNPACPLTAAGLSSRFTELSPTAVQHRWSLFAQRALRGRTQLYIELPVQERRAIATIGTVQGFGDTVLGVNHVLSVRSERLMQTIGGTISLPTGADGFSAGRSALDPAYALSFAPLSRVQVVLGADYSFGIGGTNLPFAPRVQRFRLASRAIVDVGRDWFISGSASQARVTGDYRYTTYAAGATLGFIGRHTALSISYQVPLGTYSRNLTFDHSIELEFAVRP